MTNCNNPKRLLDKFARLFSRGRRLRQPISSLSSIPNIERRTPSVLMSLSPFVAASRRNHVLLSRMCSSKQSQIDADYSTAENKRRGSGGNVRERASNVISHWLATMLRRATGSVRHRRRQRRRQRQHRRPTRF